MSDSTPPRRPLWKRVITAISLSLNVLILGALAGLLLSGSGGEGDRPPPLRNNGGIAPLIGMLPPEQRTVVLEDLRRIGKEHGVTHRQLAEDRDRVVQVITAEPFDPLRLVAVLAENQTRFASYGEGVHELLAEAVAQMSPQERAAYAERLEKAARWRDRSKGGKERSGGNPENRRGGPQDGRNSGPRDSYAPPVSAGAP